MQFNNDKTGCDEDENSQLFHDRKFKVIDYFSKRQRYENGLVKEATDELALIINY
jgi:hypothetical protein